MKLTRKEIINLTKTRRIEGMPKGTYVAGFTDHYGRYYPICTLDAFFYEGIDCELYTHMLGGAYYIRFFF